MAGEVEEPEADRPATARRGSVSLPIDPDTELGADLRARRLQIRRASPTIVGVIAVSGALGALARYGLSRALPTRAGQYPWGTFLINVSGSLAIGFVLVLLLERFPKARLARPLVVTGFLGAYTTFSTYVVDAVDLARDHHAAVAALYVVASLLGGLGAVAAGMALGRLAVRVDAALDEVAGAPPVAKQSES